MSRENSATKARRYLIEARVRVIDCDEANGVITAEVRSDGSRIYVAGRETEGSWFCDCAAWSENCAHINALKLISVLEPREPRA